MQVMSPRTTHAERLEHERDELDETSPVPDSHRVELDRLLALNQGSVMPWREVLKNIRRRA